MKELKDTCNLAVVQATPILFDKEKCIQKTILKIKECAAKQAELIVFQNCLFQGTPMG